ncbi:N-6 DNA methylase [Dactylosporangium sp. CA-092794]|uniref:N-6 DNA methylase n=1 Tax=Dactylosporangium sp. CA-092794 TaxID=3239929 RepID=UPI003D907FA3
MTNEQDTALGAATLTASGIAQLAGVGRAAVSNWRRRYADFPAPVGGTPASPTFNARAVEQWLRSQGKLHHAATEQWAWRHIESYQPATQIGDALVIAGAYLLAFTARPSQTPAILTPKQLTSRLKTIDTGLAAMLGRILPEQWGPPLTPMLRTVDQLAREQDAETAFEYLHGQYVTSAQSMSGLASTPDTVADVMLSLAGHGAVTLDFTCGTGSLLRQAVDRATRTATPTACLGQEIKPQYALIALIRLWFVHRRAQQAGLDMPPPVLHVGDSMLADAYTDVRADIVVANFPFGIHDWGHDRLAYDPRWRYGLPPRTEPELAWVQHALAHLSPGGTAVVLMPPAAALRPAGRRIRAELIRRGALRAVVALPAGLMPPAGVGLQIWALTQPDEHHEPDDRLLFVDATNAAQTLTETVTAAWRDYRSGRRTETPGVHRTVPAIDVLNDQVDLTPQRYVRPHDSESVDPAQTIAGIAAIDRLLTEIRHLLPAVRPATTGGLRTAPQASLADLVRSGSMSILRTSPRTRPADHTVLTSADILADSPPTGPTSGTATDGTPRIHTGDILIPVIGREIIARVATNDQVGAEPGPGVQILRVDPDRFDPWFVAGALTSSGNIRSATRPSTTSGALRIDLKRLTIPVLKLHEQQEYGRTYRQLIELRTALQQAATTGTALTREIGDGLTSGTLTIDTDQHPHHR